MNILKLSKMRILLTFIALIFITSNCLNDESITDTAQKLLSDNKDGGKSDQKTYDKLNAQYKIALDLSKDKKNEAVRQKDISIQKKDQAISSFTYEDSDNSTQAIEKITRAKHFATESQTAATESRTAATESRTASNSIPDSSPLRAEADRNATEAEQTATDAENAANEAENATGIQILGEKSTEIVEEAYKNQTFTKIIKIADTVTRFLGNSLMLKNTFYGATFEKDLILQSNLSILGDNTNHPFTNTTFKGKIIFSDNITSIGQLAFAKAKFNATLKLPATLISIKVFAFTGATLPAGFKIPNSVTSIETNAFKDVILPADHRWSGNLNDDPNYEPVAGDEIVTK